MDYTDDAVFNNAIDKVAAQLKSAGIEVNVSKSPHSRFKSISVKAGDESHNLRSMDTTSTQWTKEGRITVYTLTGFTVRWDHMGRRGMGTTRYPLRKDGTIDADRLKGELESWLARDNHRKQVAREVADNANSLSTKYAAIEKRVKKLSGASGSGVFIEATNDGRAEGRITFKVSGHATPDFINNLLDTIERKM